METIGDRIADLILRLKISRSKFSDTLGISAAYVSQICGNVRIPSDRTISDICRVFSVSEAWLRDGEGEMFVSLTMNQELLMMANDLMAESDDSFRKACVSALLQMPPEFWGHLQTFVDKLHSQYKAKKED